MNYVKSNQSLAVKSSYDYDLFEFFDSNRPPLHWQKIAESIENKDLTKFVPILVVKVNGGLKIVDGQNRFLACKHLGKPIYYYQLPDDCDEDIMIILNVDRKNWSIENYLNFYVSQGKQSYLLVEQILKECTNLRPHDVISIWQGKPAGKESTIEVFKKGLYSINSTGLKKCRLVSMILYAIESSVDDAEFRRKKSLIGAIASFIHVGGNPNRLISQIKRNPFLFKAQADQPHYFELLEYIYNYRKRSKEPLRYRN